MHRIQLVLPEFCCVVQFCISPEILSSDWLLVSRPTLFTGLTYFAHPRPTSLLFLLCMSSIFVPNNWNSYTRRKVWPQRIGLFSGLSSAGTLGSMALRYARGRTRRGTSFRGSRRPAKRRRMMGGSRPNVTSGQGVTVQHDRRTIYRKKSMPRYKRKRWTRFIKKVHAVAEKDLGSRTAVFNETVARTVTGPIGTNQLRAQFALYAINNGSNNYLQDITTLLAGDSNVLATGKVLFQSGVLDMTVRNLSVDHASVQVPVEVDVYEIISGKTWENAASDKGLLDIFAQAESDTGPIGAGTSLSLANRGVTPWDVPQCLSQWRLKILKKTKYELSYGQTFTYQIRDPRRHLMDKTSIADMTGGNMPGVTRWILILGKMVPGFTDGASATLNLTTGLTRKFLYKVDEENIDQDAYNL